MAFMKGSRIGVTIYLTPETYRALEDIKSPYLSTSAHCAMILDEAANKYAIPNQVD